MGNITAVKAQGIVATYRKEGSRSRSLAKQKKSSAASLTKLVDLAKLLKKRGQRDLAYALASEQQAMYQINLCAEMGAEPEASEKSREQLRIARRQVRTILAGLEEAEEASTDVTVHYPTGRTTYTVGDRISGLVNDGSERDGHKVEGEVVSATPYTVTVREDDGRIDTLTRAGALITVMVSITLNEKRQAVLLEATAFGNLMGTPTQDRDHLVALGLARYQGLRLVLTEKGEFIAKEVKRALFVRNARKAQKS